MEDEDIRKLMKSAGPYKIQDQAYLRDEINVKADWLIEKISRVVNILVPIRTCTIKGKWINKKWFNAEILQAIKERDKLYRQAIKTRNVEGFAKFKKKRIKVAQRY
ncbi:hypothetical protein KPH14_001213 [Odynerus spinipes]|uniref:Uncharacterized protein n=1 Tax=Odynerus spinipes TaxID=1348599 RepID=A0AAD9VRC3_9HYME|nr:hypothetical protein KPH14_001213 [Odynerus spinipes]